MSRSLAKFVGTIIAPNALIHLHIGLDLVGEVVGRFIRVEPITATTPETPVCGCITDIAHTKNTTTIAVTGDGLDAISAAGGGFFLKTDCNVDGCLTSPAACGTQATVEAGGTPTNVTLDIPAGTPAGTYHVVGKASSGVFCTKETVTLP